MKDFPLYNPERPVMPEYNGCNPPVPPCPAKPFPNPPKPGCECEPPYPPGHNPCIPQITPVPPVPSPLQGSSLYECMQQQTQRINQVICQWNELGQSYHENIHRMLAVARANDVYYDKCEVSYQEGYDDVEGAAYSIVEKKAVDKKGEPIFVQLMPAYNNTANPGVKQKIFDASFVTSANVIITAVQADANTWDGPAMYNGAAIPGTEVENGYVYGFTKRGALRYFPSNINSVTLTQQGMVNVIGGCVPLVYDGKVLDEVVEMTTREAITAIGFNSGTGSVFFFSCSAQNEPGMSLARTAQILIEFGCTVAVCTSHTVNSLDVKQTEGMLYMGQMATDPNQAIQPDNVAYWVVSKRCCFRNDLQQEIADLIQRTGRNQWENYLLGVQIQQFDNRITANTEAIKAEQERAMQAEAWLQENINKEVNRAMQAEAWLQENINKEVERATAAEQAETERAKTEERRLDEKIDAETDRAKAAESALRQEIQDERLRAINREREIQDALDQEIVSRINADNDIINSIEQEILARRAADTELRTYIEKLINETKTDFALLEQKVNSLISGAIELPYLKLTGGTMTGDVTFTSGNTIVLGRGPTLDMQAATKKYVDDAVKAGGGGGTGGDVSKEYVDQQIQNVQDQIDGKVSKDGDTMTGTLNMGGNKIEDPVLSASTGVSVEDGAGGPGTITNLANPTNPTDAVNKSYTDQKISEAIEGATEGLKDSFLPLAGGQMSGNIKIPVETKIALTDVTGETEQGGLSTMADGSTVLESANGMVKLEGSEISVGTPAGDTVPLVGVSQVGPQKTGSGITFEGDVHIKSDNLYIDPVATAGPSDIHGVKEIGRGDHESTDTKLVLEANEPPEGEDTIKPSGITTELFVVGKDLTKPTGIITSGGLIVNDSSGNTSAIIDPHDGHLDLTLKGTDGSVFINRGDTTGGTGEIWATELHAPQELRLSPATNVNVLQHKITNVADPVNEHDAVNLRTLNSKTMPTYNVGNTITRVVNGTTYKLAIIVKLTINNSTTPSVSNYSTVVNKVSSDYLIVNDYYMSISITKTECASLLCELVWFKEGTSPLTNYTPAIFPGFSIGGTMQESATGGGYGLVPSFCGIKSCYTASGTVNPYNFKDCTIHFMLGY